MRPIRHTGDDFTGTPFSPKSENISQAIADMIKIKTDKARKHMVLLLTVTFTALVVKCHLYDYFPKPPTFTVRDIWFRS